MPHRNYYDEQVKQIIDIVWEAAEIAYGEYIAGDHGRVAIYDLPNTNSKGVLIFPGLLHQSEP